MRSPSKLLVTLICIFIIAFKCTSAAAFVQNGLGQVHKINGIASKNFCLPKSFNQDIKEMIGMKMKGNDWARHFVRFKKCRRRIEQRKLTDAEFRELIINAFLHEMAKLTSLPITHFEADRAIENYKGPVLWVHDEGDRVCPYEDLLIFKNKAPENIKFLITNGLGHNKVYKTPDVIEQIVTFFSV
jgi:pimeloyl-ACP methyl ester carboxylesterase